MACQEIEGAIVRKILVFGVLFLASLVTSANAEEATVFQQDESPIEIQTYTNRYRAPDRVGDGTIIHRVYVKNVSDKKILAYGLGFYIFDSFKRDMGRPFIGYAMNTIEAGAVDEPGWEQRPGSAFLFEGYGHGLAYVSIVRFDDGSIWKADQNEISRQLEDFQLELSGDNLE